MTLRAWKWDSGGCDYILAFVCMSTDGDCHFYLPPRLGMRQQGELETAAGSNNLSGFLLHSLWKGFLGPGLALVLGPGTHQ